MSATDVSLVKEPVALEQLTDMLRSLFTFVK